MINYRGLFELLEDTPLAPWLERLPGQLEAAFARPSHGDLPKWQAAIDGLPRLTPSDVDLRADTVRIGRADDVDAATREIIERQLRELHPWRKGPFDVFGVRIDTEWHSDWKWNRLKDDIAPLAGRLVLDVGCGSGYHCWRMAGEGARLTIGIDPTLVYVMQFAAIQRFAQRDDVQVLPLGIDDLPQGLTGVDTVFSMGVLYHRRSPIDHLLELKALLRPGGELVLETLVIEGGSGQVLVPQDRYARMRNVWFIPSSVTLAHWLERCGFHAVRVVGEATTSTEEQRSTSWMKFQSLSDFLMPGDPRLTVEGLPAPRRAVFIAENPG